MSQRFTREQPRVAPVTATPILVEIEAEYVPLLFSAIEKYHNAKYWVSEGDYQGGRAGIIRLERALLTDMSSQIVEAIDRLYRLHDSHINGTAYAASAPDPQTGAIVVTPAIPPAPPAPDTRGLLALRNNELVASAALTNLAQNIIFPEGTIFPGSPPFDQPSIVQAVLNAQGIINAGWFGIGGQNATLADIVNAQRVGSPTDQGLINNALDEILNASGNTATIFNTVRGLLDSVVDGVTEGGILSVLIASSIASAATAGAQANQLQRIIDSLDGGGLLRPADNILLALRGDQVADPANAITPLLRALGGSDPNNPTPGALTSLETLRAELATIRDNSGVQVNIQGELALALEAIQGYLTGGAGADTQPELLRLIAQAVRSLAGLEATGQRVEGSAFQILADALDCICENTGELVAQGSQPTFPPFEAGACSPLDTLGATATATFDANGESGPLDWSLVGGSQLGTGAIPNQTGLGIVVNGDRELCVQIVAPAGVPVDAVGLVATPFRLSDGAQTGAATIQFEGIGSFSDTFFASAPDNGGAIGYIFTLASGTGEPVNYQIRVYLAYGPFG